MIRSVVTLFAFAVVLCGLIVLRPFAADEDPVADTGISDAIETAEVTAPPAAEPDVEEVVEVTRAATPQTNVTAIVEAALDAEAAPEPAVVVTPEPEVAAAVVEAPRRMDVARPNTDSTRLSDMTNNVLAELGFQGVEHITTEAEEQRQSTAQILAGIEAATGQTSALKQSDTLEAIVVAALREGQSDDTIDEMVNNAAVEGTIAVPEILVTSDGRVDTHVLLNNIVTQAHIAAGGTAPEIPDVNPNDTAGVEVRFVQRANESVQARFYTVQQGDSLGAIAIKFFGDAAYYTTIFEANRALLSSPDRIRAGQRLVIPELQDA